MKYNKWWTITKDIKPYEKWSNDLDYTDNEVIEAISKFYKKYKKTKTYKPAKYYPAFHHINTELNPNFISMINQAVSEKKY